MSEEPTQNLPQDAVGLILARLDSIDSRLTTLEDKVDRRLQETRPIWEQVLVRLDGFEKRLDDFGLQLRSSLRSFERSVAEMTKDVLQVRGYQNDLEARMDKIESKAT